MKKGNLFFTVANYGYREFLLNFVTRWRQMQMGDFLVLCLDSNIFSFCKTHGILAQLHHQNISEGFHSWKQQQYRKIVFRKLDLKTNLIRENHANYNYLTYIDTDIWLNKNFLSVLDTVCSANDFDILFQDGEKNDRGETSVLESDGTISRVRDSENFCTGFMVMNMKNHKQLIELLSYQIQDMFDFVGNQPFLNNKIKNFKSLRCISLPKLIAPNTSPPQMELSSDSWFLHYTYLVGETKKDLMMSNGHWIVSC
jgi:hypothetical protein